MITWETQEHNMKKNRQKLSKTAKKKSFHFHKHNNITGERTLFITATSNTVASVFSTRNPKICSTSRLALAVGEGGALPSALPTSSLKCTSYATRPTLKTGSTPGFVHYLGKWHHHATAGRTRPCSRTPADSGRCSSPEEKRGPRDPALELLSGARPRAQACGNSQRPGGEGAAPGRAVARSRCSGLAPERQTVPPTLRARLSGAPSPQLRHRRPRRRAARPAAGPRAPAQCAVPHRLQLGSANITQFSWSTFNLQTGIFYIIFILFQWYTRVLFSKLPNWSFVNCQILPMLHD